MILMTLNKNLINMETFFYILFGILVLLHIITYSSYKNFKKSILSELNNLNNPIRKGYIKTSVSHIQTNKPINFILYVNELERYTSGDSKCEFNDIEILSTLPEDCDEIGIKNFVRNNMKHLRRTDEVTWLEPIASLKVERTDKLQKLLNRIKKQKQND